MEGQDPVITARIAAGNVLTIASGHAAASLDKLATWFLVGFGGGLAFILPNLKDISDYIPLQTISSAACLFIWASVTCLAQRYVAMSIEAGVASWREAMGIQHTFNGIDLAEFISQMKKTPWIFRVLVSGSFDAIARGDFATSGRMLLRLTLIQGCLALLEVILLLIGLGRILSAIQ